MFIIITKKEPYSGTNRQKEEEGGEVGLLAQ